MNQNFVKKVFLGTLLFTVLNVSNCIVAFNNMKLIDLPEKTIDLNEQLISGYGKDKILVISIEGVIMDTPESGAFGLSSGDSMVARVKEELSKASQDQDIKGVILKVVVELLQVISSIVS